MSDEVPVLVGTLAFGLGINKAAVRAVIHLAMPKSKPAQTHTLYLRTFPRELSRELKSRAALAGLTMPRYLAALLKEYFSKA